ncbi:MAG: protein kinase [Gemmatimonadetes bacterium]|nr:protein kinase [Gemmatimonadota bacterium]
MVNEELERLTAALADRYLVERELGRGGMATVYLAQDLKHERPVAVKVLHPELAAVLGSERFLREIKLTARLTHPHILPLLDSGEADGQLFYVMPYVEGESLRDRLSREKQLPLDDALQVAREVADALAYAHGRDVVHRDIKPENILLEAGHAVVSDFGIARAVDQAGGEKLTGTGVALGTPAYMSPEQAAGSKDLDGRSDLYSLGCALYEMLAGQPPFTGPTADSLVRQHLSAVPPSVTVIRPAVPAWLDVALGRCLAKTPADRFRTAQELSEALLGTETAETAPRTRVTSRKHWRAVALGSVVVLAIAAAVGLYVRPAVFAAHPAIRSITVFPVKSLGADTSSAVLAEALSLALSTRLGQLGGIEVKGNWSATRYRDQERSDADLAQDLGVDAVLHTTLLRQRDSVQVYAQLFSAAGRMAWANRYDYALQSMLVLSSAVARDIAQGIQVTLTNEEEQQLAAAPAVNPAAYEQYAWGQLLFTQRGDGLRRGLAYFQRAIALDSGFADAWAGLADTYNLLGIYGFLPGTLAYPRGRAAAEIALRLDASNARAHTALAAIHGWYDLDPEASLREFQAAIRSNPEYWIAYAWRSPILQVLGRSEEAIASGRQAIEGDRYYPIAHMALGWRDYAAGDFEQAVQRFRRILDITPESPVARWLLGRTLTELGRYADAEAELRLALAHPGHSASVDAQLAYLLARTGHRDSAVAILADLKRRYRAQAGDTMIHVYVSALDIAIAHVGLGQSDSALVWLNRAFDDKGSDFFLLPVEPRFRSLRADPRFRALLNRYWIASSP